MALANILSSTFRLHQPQPVQGAQTQQQQGAPNIGSPATGLQNIEGMTDAYYQKWGDLQSFAQEMNSFGIDVTKPDWRSKEAMEAHRVYTKAMADLQYQGNRMQEGQKMMSKFAQARLSAHGQDIGYLGDQSAGVFDPGRITNTGMTSLEKNAAEDSRIKTQQEGFDRRQTELIDARAEQGKLNREWDKELAGLKTKKAQNEFVQKMSPYANITSELTNAAAGNVEWKPSTLLNPNDVPYLQAEFWGGEQMGYYEDVTKDVRGNDVVKNLPRTVRGLLQDPQTNEIWLEYEHGGKQLLNQNSIAQLTASRAESATGLKASDAREFSQLVGKEDIDVMPVSAYNLSQANTTAAKIKEDGKIFQDLNRMGPGIDLVVDGVPINIHKESDSWTGLFKATVRVENGEQIGLKKNGKFTGAEVARALHERGHYAQKAAPPGVAREVAPPKPVQMFDPKTGMWSDPVDTTGQQQQAPPIVDQQAPPVVEQAAPIAAETPIAAEPMAVSQWRNTKAKKERLRWDNDRTDTEVNNTLAEVKEVTKMGENTILEAWYAFTELEDPDDAFLEWFQKGGYKVGLEREQASLGQ